MGGVTPPLKKGNISCEEKEAGTRDFGEFKTTEGTRGMSGDGDNNNITMRTGYKGETTPRVRLETTQGGITLSITSTE